MNGLKKIGNGDSPNLKRTHHFFIRGISDGLEWRRLTRITNNKREKFTLKVSNRTNRVV